MKRTLFFAIAVLVLFSQLLVWFCRERAAYVWPPGDIDFEGRAILRQHVANISYAIWLMGEGDPQQALRLYAGSLALLANDYDSEAEQLNAYAELRLVAGRMALVARKAGDEEGYGQHMEGALAASQRYAAIMATYGGARYHLEREAEIIELVEWMDEAMRRLMQRAIADQQQAVAAEQSGAAKGKQTANDVAKQQ